MLFLHLWPNFKVRQLRRSPRPFLLLHPLQAVSQRQTSHCENSGCLLLSLNFFTSYFLLRMSLPLFVTQPPFLILGVFASHNKT